MEKKDEFFNWYEPQRATKSRMGEVIRVQTGKKARSLTVSYDLLELLGISKTEKLRLAFDFSDDNPFVVFNPVPGVPFVIAPLAPHAKSPRLNSKDLVKKFVRRFGLDEDKSYHDFELVYLLTTKDMKLYKMVLVEPKEE